MSDDKNFGTLPIEDATAIKVALMTSIQNAFVGTKDKPGALPDSVIDAFVGQIEDPTSLNILFKQIYGVPPRFLRNPAMYSPVADLPEARQALVLVDKVRRQNMMHEQASSFLLSEIEAYGQGKTGNAPVWSHPNVIGLASMILYQLNKSIWQINVM